MSSQFREGVIDQVDYKTMKTHFLSICVGFQM
jgi:hypothetical protein